MRRWAAALVIIVVASACGGGDDESGQDAPASSTTTTVASTTSTSAVPVALPGLLAGGSHRTAVFEPELQFEVDPEQWRLEVDQEDVVLLRRSGDDAATLAVLRPEGVIPPGGGPEEPLPDDPIAWLATHTAFTVAAETTTRAVGSERSTCVDIVVAGSSAVDLFVIADGVFGLEPGASGFVCLVDGDLDPPVVIVADAPSASAPAHLAEVDDLLASVRMTVG